MLRDADRGNTCLILPTGSEVLIESTSDAGQTANIRYEERDLWMFCVDLEDRGILIQCQNAEMVALSRPERAPEQDLHRLAGTE